MGPTDCLDLFTESAALLREALEVAEHASCVMNARGDILFCNRAFTHLTGYEAAELARAGYTVLRSDTTSAESYRTLWHTVRQGHVWHGEIEYRHKDGSSRPCSVVITPFGKSGRFPEYFYVTQMDLTDERAREQQRLRAREDLEREVRLRTEELAKLYSISAALHTSLDLEETLQIVLVAVTAGEGYRFNRAVLFLREHGDPGWLVGRLAVGPFTAEEARRIWSALSAIEHAEEPLADLVRRYSAHLEGSEGGLNELVRGLRIPLDRERSPLAHSVRQKCAVQVGNSPEANNQWDWTGLEGLQSPAFAVVPLVYRGEAEGCVLVDNAITRHPIDSEEIRILTLFADHAAHAIANAMLYEQSQALLQERNTALDQLQANQERLVQAEKLAALGRMAAIVVHELRTPLAVIGGYARHLLKKIPDGSPLEEDLAVVRDEVSRLEDVVERLLFYAKPKDPLLKRANLNQCLRDLITYLSEEFDKHGIRVETELAYQLPDSWFDERQMRQVFLNLITNAIQAMPDGGTIRISTTLDGDSLCATVADTGPGIDPRILPHIFEPFLTTKPKGTGLGLHVSQRILEGHCGEIRAESLPGGGSAFTLCVPLVPGDRMVRP